jgi:hypothetical protein
MFGDAAYYVCKKASASDALLEKVLRMPFKSMDGWMDGWMVAKKMDVFKCNSR